MPCCTPTITTFVNETTTTVPYVGERPTVTVSYLVDGVWYAEGVASVVQVTGSSVVVTHGGASTGVVVMLQ